MHCISPADAWYIPAAQAVHADDSAIDAALPFRYLPAAHNTHESAFTSDWYRPASQPAHSRFDDAVGATV